MEVATETKNQFICQSYGSQNVEMLPEICYVYKTRRCKCNSFGHWENIYFDLLLLSLLLWLQAMSTLQPMVYRVHFLDGNVNSVFLSFWHSDSVLFPYFSMSRDNLPTCCLLSTTPTLRVLYIYTACCNSISIVSVHSDYSYIYSNSSYCYFYGSTVRTRR